MTDPATETGVLQQLFAGHFGIAATSVQPLAGGGSPRRYYLLTAPGGFPAAVGTCGDDRTENKTFISLADHFAAAGLPVPNILAYNSDGSAYLQSYIPGQSLLEHLNNSADPRKLIDAAMRLLCAFHYEGSRGLDFRKCGAETELDAASVAWDLNYFKYSFLKVSGTPFSERALQHDFDNLAATLLKGSKNWHSFMYRDFQSRNIIVDPSGNLHAIDFQGGRRGPAQYDAVSFLWQAKADFSPEMKQWGLDCYCRHAAVSDASFDRQDFISSLPYFVLFRQLQTLGAYGFRGLIERKKHFIDSLPLGIKNLKYLFSEEFPQLAEEFPQLAEIAASLILPTNAPKAPDGRLTITVQSFSYRKGYPEDTSGNGGGFIFDCRAVHNPGRYERYKPLTGMDRPVIEFLENDGEIISFLQNAYDLVDSAVEKYLRRGFTSLCVGFGCTGGRHRSVYSAHAMASHLREKYPQVNVVEIHREQPGLVTA